MKFTDYPKDLQRIVELTPEGWEEGATCAQYSRHFDEVGFLFAFEKDEYPCPEMLYTRDQYEQCRAQWLAEMAEVDWRDTLEVRPVELQYDPDDVAFKREEKTMKTVSDAVRQEKGVWADDCWDWDQMIWKSGGIDWASSRDASDIQRIKSGSWQLVCTRAQFEAEAERLGYRDSTQRYQTSFGVVTLVATDADDSRVCVRDDQGRLSIITTEQLRPLQSERDKWIEAACNAMIEAYRNADGPVPSDSLSESDREAYAAAIFDANLGRLPE